MRAAMNKGEKQVAEAQEALAKHISHMQEKLQEARDTRCGKSGTAAREEFIAQCQGEIGKGSGSAAVYQAVFQTIEGPESEGMAKYQVAAKALQSQLRQAAPECEQTSAGLDDLYKQALSVEDRALEVMNGLRTPSESSKDSAGGWRLEKPALKKLRCAMHTHSIPLLMPPLHLSTSPPLLMTVSCARSQPCMREGCAGAWVQSNVKDGNYQWRQGWQRFPTSAIA